jgi:hypothetical protein
MPQTLAFFAINQTLAFAVSQQQQQQQLMKRKIAEAPRRQIQDG